MKFWDIIREVGGGIIENVVPGGNIIMGAINGLLPKDKQLPLNATGQQAQDAINSLTPALKAQVMNKEFDVKLEQIKQSYDTLRTMLVSDATNPHSTRPKIAYQSFQVVAFCIIAVVSTWCYAVLSRDDAMVKTIVEGWPWLLAVITPLVILLHAYFGVLKKEKIATLDASNNRPASSGLLGVLTTAFKK